MVKKIKLPKYKGLGTQIILAVAGILILTLNVGLALFLWGAGAGIFILNVQRLIMGEK